VHHGRLIGELRRWITFASKNVFGPKSAHLRRITPQHLCIERIARRMSAWKIDDFNPLPCGKLNYATKIKIADRLIIKGADIKLEVTDDDDVISESGNTTDAKQQRSADKPAQEGKLSAYSRPALLQRPCGHAILPRLFLLLLRTGSNNIAC
jgi:hypothetical protein